MFLCHFLVLPSGKHTKNYGKSPFLMGKLTISMAIFNTYVKLPEGNHLSIRVPKFDSYPRERKLVDQ